MPRSSMMSSGMVESSSHALFASSIQRCFCEFSQERMRLSIEHTIALLDRRQSDGLGQVTFTGAWRTEQQCVFMMGNEVRGCEIEDKAAVHLFVEVEVEVVERLQIAKACGFSSPFQQAVTAAREFVGDQT